MLFFDYIVLTLLVVLAIRGAMKGLVAQITSVASVVIGWILAARCHAAISPMIPIDDPWNRYVAMLILFVGGWIGIHMCGGMISGWLKKINVKEFDRQLGFLLGLVKGLLLCMVLTFFAVSLSETTREPVLSSKSGHYLSLAIVKTGALIPDDLCQRLHAQIDAFRDKLEAEQGGATIQASGTTGNEGQGGAPEKKEGSSFWNAVTGFFSSDASHSTDEPASETRQLIEKLDKGVTVMNELDKLFSAPRSLTDDSARSVTSSSSPAYSSNASTPASAGTDREVPFIPSSIPTQVSNSATELSVPAPSPAYGSIGAQPFTPISSPQHSGASFDPQAWGRSLK